MEIIYIGNPFEKEEIDFDENCTTQTCRNHTCALHDCGVYDCANSYGCSDDSCGENSEAYGDAELD